MNCSRHCFIGFLLLFFFHCQRCAGSKYWLKYTANFDLGILLFKLMNARVPYVYTLLISIYIVVLCISMVYIKTSNFIQVTKSAHREGKTNWSGPTIRTLGKTVHSIWSSRQSRMDLCILLPAPPPSPLQSTQHSFRTVSQWKCSSQPSWSDWNI